MNFRLSKYVITEIDENSVMLLSLISGKGIKIKPLVYDLILSGEFEILPHELLNKLIVNNYIVNYDDAENIDLLIANNLVSQDCINNSKTFFVGLSTEGTNYYGSDSFTFFQKEIQAFLDVNPSRTSSFLFLIDKVSNINYSNLVKSIIPKDISKQFSYVFCYSNYKELYIIDDNFFEDIKNIYVVFDCTKNDSLIHALLNLISFFNEKKQTIYEGLSITLFCNFSIENLDNLTVFQLLNEFSNIFNQNVSCSIFFKDIYNGLKESVLLSRRLKEFDIKTVTLPERKYSYINSINPVILKNGRFSIVEIDTSDTWDINDISINENSIIVLRQKYNENIIEIIKGNQCFNCDFLPICGGNNKNELFEIEDCPRYTFNLQHTIKHLF
jgi:hypothetical protein